MTAATALQAGIPMVDVPRKRTRGLGALEVLGPVGKVSLPLAGVEVRARVAGRVAEVTIAQKFHNPFAEPLEATYIFPLAGASAVSRFELLVAGRVIIGKVEERGEARRQYQAALDEGRRAALLEQERDDVFTVQVGNLPPGEEATVRLTYSERLAFFEDGATELRLPLVVAPRYMAGEAVDRAQAGSGTAEDTTLVPDASRLSPPRLVPGFDPKVALSLSVELIREKGSNGFDELACSQHATRTSTGPDSVGVALSRTDEAMDRDFVLRWRSGGAQVSTSLLVHKAPEGDSFAMLTLLPPKRDGFLGLPRDVVFVVDRSGSMEGSKMTSAARACSTLLATLGPRDRFAVQAFDDVAEWLQDGPEAAGRFLAAGEAGVEKGEKYLRAITARNGTELDMAMREAIAALDARKDGAGRTGVIVLLTDGQIGDESSVLRRLQTALGDARVFTVGIDTAVNDGFLKRLAAVGGGTATFVEPGAQLEEALRAVAREIGTPLVTELILEDVDSQVDAGSLAPARLPDLFAGRAATTFFRVGKSGKVRVRGKLEGGGKFEQLLEAQEIALPALAQLWARGRVMDLEDRFRLASAALAPRGSPAADTIDKLKAEIVALAIRHTLLTRFTAFVAVDQAEIVNPGGNRHKVVQPVAEPAGWEMQTSLRAKVLRGFAPMPMVGAAGMRPTNLPPPPAAGAVWAQAPQAPTGLADGFAEVEAMASSPSESSAGGPPSKSEGSALGGLGAMANKVAGALRGRGKKDSRHEAPPSVAEGASDHLRAADERASDERRAVKLALDAFAKALDRVKSDLQAGQLPDAKALEVARKALLQALAASALASMLPALQRFLRTGAAELEAALQAPAMSAASLLPLCERHAAAFATARAEADKALSGAPGGPPGSFWEASI